MDKKYIIKDSEIKKVMTWNGADGCFASDKITVEGNKIGYMYREQPDSEIDSGWRFFAGNESDDYVNNANNIGLFKLNTICNYDKEIIPLLNSPVGSTFIRDKNGVLIQE